jgi:hypothetical protein
MIAFFSSVAAWLFSVAAVACLASAALGLFGINVEWPVAFGIVVLAMFADAGSIGWPAALLAAVFFGALAFGFAGLRALARDRRPSLKSSALSQS